MAIRFFLMGILALILASCASIPPPALPISDIQSFKLSGVEVRGSDVIRSWPAEEEVFIASAQATPDIINRLRQESAQNFPAVQAYFHRRLTEIYTSAFQASVSPLFVGQRPVKIIITLREFDVPSLARRVLIDQMAKLYAAIDVVDAKTGQLILSYPGRRYTSGMIGGWMAPIAASMSTEDIGARLLTQSVFDYRTWLITR